MAKILRYLLSPEEKDQITLFYLERLLEMLDSGCIVLAQTTFSRHQTAFSELLSPEAFQQLSERVSVRDNWNSQKEKHLYKRLQNAFTFGESKISHDLAHEILLHHDHLAESCPNHAICDSVNKLLANNNNVYLEPDEIAVNTIIDAPISFIVEERKPKQNGFQPLRGNPGFYLQDALGRRYRCFVKQMPEANVGDVLSLKVTNIPGLAIAAHGESEPILYLEPRANPGEIIEIELSSLSHTGNSYTFRYHSYDGFLWFKRRGVNRTIFNENTLRKGDRIIAKVLYISEEEKRTADDKVSRLGVIKAIPLRRGGEAQSLAESPSIGAATALS